jgi:hypothetical protein
MWKSAVIRFTDHGSCAWPKSWSVRFPVLRRDMFFRKSPGGGSNWAARRRFTKTSGLGRRNVMDVLCSMLQGFRYGPYTTYMEVKWRRTWKSQTKQQADCRETLSLFPCYALLGQSERGQAITHTRVHEHQSLYLFVNLQPIYPSITPTIHLSSYLPISLSLSICLSVYPSVHLSVCPSNYPLIFSYPSIHLFICPSIRPSVYLPFYIYLSGSSSISLSIESNWVWSNLIKCG